MACSLHLEHVSKSYGPLCAVADITLDVNSGELFFLLGPSGCGKTTVLRVVAGFCEPDEGTLRFGARVMNGVAPHRRNTGMVFQSYALWPHMSVFDNVAYGLAVRGLPANERRELVLKMLDMVRLTEQAEKFPTQLSGGQQQRVAVARALVIGPDVLLLDEPLSNLDANLRYELRQEIRRIHTETKVTAVYVTHDQKEALEIADRVAVMNAGRIEQIGTPREIYRRPASRFVARFLGEVNFLSGRVVSCDAEEVRVETAAGPVAARDLTASFTAGSDVTVGVRPECVTIGTKPSGTRDTRFAARVVGVGYMGDREQVELSLTAPAAEGARFTATLLNAGDLRLEPGADVTVSFAASDVMLLPP